MTCPNNVGYLSLNLTLLFWALVEFSSFPSHLWGSRLQIRHVYILLCSWSFFFWWLSISRARVCYSRSTFCPSPFITSVQGFFVCLSSTLSKCLRHFCLLFFVISVVSWVLTCRFLCYFLPSIVVLWGRLLVHKFFSCMLILVLVLFVCAPCFLFPCSLHLSVRRYSESLCPFSIKDTQSYRW